MLEPLSKVVARVLFQYRSEVRLEIATHSITNKEYITNCSRNLVVLLWNLRFE